MTIGPVATVFSFVLIKFWLAFVAAISQFILIDGMFWFAIVLIAVILFAIPHFLENFRYD